MAAPEPATGSGDLAGALRKVRKESRRLLRATDAAVGGEAAAFALAGRRSQQIKGAMAQVMAALGEKSADNPGL